MSIVSPRVAIGFSPYADNSPSPKIKENSITFIQFLEEAVRIIHNSPNLELANAKVFIKRGNAIHMAVELLHHDYIKYFASKGIPVNDLNSELKTPFYLAVEKKNRQMKLKLLHLLKGHKQSPFLSFNVRDSPLKMCLRQQDLDSAYELVKNDEFVNEFLDELPNERKGQD